MRNPFTRRSQTNGPDDAAEQAQLAAEIKRLEAEMERQRLANEIKQMEAALQQKQGGGNTASVTQQQPKKVVRKVVKKRVIKKANGDTVTVIVNDNDADKQNHHQQQIPQQDLKTADASRVQHQEQQQQRVGSEATMATMESESDVSGTQGETTPSSTNSIINSTAAALRAQRTKQSVPVVASTPIDRPSPLSSTHPLAAMLVKRNAPSVAPVVTTETTAKETTEPLAMKDDPRFAKYWKMQVIKLPQGAIQHALIKDKMDPRIIDMDWQANYEDQKNGIVRTIKKTGGNAKASNSANTTSKTSSRGGPPMKDDPRFVKYYKMKTVRLPQGAILNAMTRDGVDSSILQLDWDCNYEQQLGGKATTASTGTTASVVNPMAAALEQSGGKLKPTMTTSANTDTPKASGNALMAAIQGGVKLKSSVTESRDSTSSSPRKTGNPLVDAISGGVKLKSASRSNISGVSRPTGNPLMDAIAGGVKLKSTSRDFKTGDTLPEKPSGNPLMAAIQAGVKLKPAAARVAHSNQHVDPLVAAIAGGVKLKSRAPRCPPSRSSSNDSLAAQAVLGLANLKKTKRTVQQKPPEALLTSDPLMEAMAKRNALKSRSTEATSQPSPASTASNQSIPKAGMQLKSRSSKSPTTLADKQPAQPFNPIAGVQLKSRSREPSPERPTSKSVPFNPIASVQLKSRSREPSPERPTSKSVPFNPIASVQLKSRSREPSPERPTSKSVPFNPIASVQLKSRSREPSPERPTSKSVPFNPIASVQLKSRSREPSPERPTSKSVPFNPIASVQLKSRSREPSPERPTSKSVPFNPIASVQLKSRSREPSPERPTSKSVPFNPIASVQLKSRSREPSPERPTSKSVPFNPIASVQLKSRSREPSPERPTSKSVPFNPIASVQLKSRSREPSPERPTSKSVPFNPIASVQLKSRSREPSPERPTSKSVPFNPIASVQLKSRSREPSPERPTSKSVPFNPIASVQLKSRPESSTNEIPFREEFSSSAGAQLKSKSREPSPEHRLVFNSLETVPQRSHSREASSEGPAESFNPIADIQPISQSRTPSPKRPSTTNDPAPGMPLDSQLTVTPPDERLTQEQVISMADLRPIAADSSNEMLNTTDEVTLVVPTSTPSLGIPTRSSDNTVREEEISVKHNHTPTEQQEPLPTTTVDTRKKQVVKRKIVKKKPKPATTPSGPSEEEQARILMEEIARVEAEILRKQQLEKEIKEMEAMIAAAEAAANKAPKATRTVVKRRVIKAAPKNQAPTELEFSASDVVQPKAVQPQLPPESQPIPVVTTLSEEPTGPMPAWAAKKRRAQQQVSAPVPIALDGSQPAAPEPAVAPSIPKRRSMDVSSHNISLEETTGPLPSYISPSKMMLSVEPETQGLVAEDSTLARSAQTHALVTPLPEPATTTPQDQYATCTEPIATAPEPVTTSLTEPMVLPVQEDAVPAWAAKRRTATSQEIPQPQQDPVSDYAEPTVTPPQDQNLAHSEIVPGEPLYASSSQSDPSYTAPNTFVSPRTTESVVQDAPTPHWAARRDHSEPNETHEPSHLEPNNDSDEQMSPLVDTQSVPSSVIQENHKPSAAQEMNSFDKGLPMKEDPRFAKYWKMMIVKLPDGAILNALARDGVEESVFAMDWERNYENQINCPNAATTANRSVAKEEEVAAEAYGEEYYDENLGYYDQEGYWHWYENEGYYDEEGNWIWYPYEEEEEEEEEAIQEHVEDEPSPEPVNRGGLLSSIALAAKNREKRLEETDGQLIMQEHEPEVASKNSGAPQLSFSLTEMVTKKAREREARLEAGGEKKMTKIKEKEEYKKDFNSVALEAAALGRLTRLNEHTIEAVAQEKTPEEEWKSQGLLAIQWRSNHMAVIFEAARAGAAFKLPEKVVSNYPELEEEWNYEDEEELTPRMQQLLDMTNEVGTGQHKVDKLVLGIKEENAGGESLAIKPMIYYQNLEDVKLPRPAPPKIDIEKHKKKLDEKARISRRPLSNISDYVAEKAWERRTRLDRPGAMPRMKTFCECPYCINPTPYQTHAYKEKARHAKTEAEMKEEAEKERQRLREERRKRRDAVMAKRLEEAEKELQERNKQKSYTSLSAESRTSRVRSPRVRPSVSNGDSGNHSTQNAATVPSVTATAAKPVSTTPTADTRRALRQARKAQLSGDASSSNIRRPAVRAPRSVSVGTPVTNTTTSQVPAMQPNQPVPNASQSQPSKLAGPPATTARPMRPVKQQPAMKNPGGGAASPATAGTSVTTTVTTRTKNGKTMTTTVVRKGPKPGSNTQPNKPVVRASPSLATGAKTKGLFGGVISGSKTTVKKKVIRK